MPLRRLKGLIKYALSPTWRRSYRLARLLRRVRDLEYCLREVGVIR